MQGELFSAFPGVVLSRPEDFSRHRAFLPPVLRPCIDPFDAQAVLDLILHEVKEKLAVNGDYPFRPQNGEIVFLTPRQENTVPHQTGNWVVNGILSFDAGDYAAAIEFLSMVMVQEPSNPLPPAYLGFVAAHQGLLREAVNFIARAERAAPGRADLKAAFGEEMLKTGHPEIAAAYLEEAVKLQPDLLAAYPALARSLHLIGRSEEAVSILQTVALIAGSAQADIHGALLQILAERGDLPGFSRCCQKLLSGDAGFCPVCGTTNVHWLSLPDYYRGQSA
jgi:tetratricopeptide (TPR) repeat protein